MNIKIENYFNKFIFFLNNPYKFFLIIFTSYFLLSFASSYLPWERSDFPYFNFMADSLLHGQLNFRLEPPSTHDLVLMNEKIYSYWAPFPDLLFLPFITIFGIQFSDILFTIFLGSINVSLVYFCLKESVKKQIFDLNEFQIIILTIFFALGTAHLTMAPLGRVWFTALIIGVTCILFTYISAIRFTGTFAFFLTGIGISAALATRSHLMFAGIWPVWKLISHLEIKSFKNIVSKLLILIFPVLITLILISTYNYSRFNNILETGLNYHNMSSVFKEDFSKYGLFNIHFVLRNFYYQNLAYPFFARSPFSFFMGGSLFFLSPVFFASFWTIVKEKRNLDTWILVITIIFINGPILLYMATGFVQFGSRFSLDFIIPLLFLTAKGLKYWSKRIIILLTFISIFQNIIGYFILAKYG